MNNKIIVNNDFIRVKLLCKLPVAHLRKQLPKEQPVWGKCKFIFDKDERNYDWLVVYDDLPPSGTERRSLRKEVLACPRQHTMLVTTEPSSIKAYGQAYTAQFGCVLTSQEKWALSHPDKIYSQSANHWFYGTGSKHQVNYNVLKKRVAPEKTGLISMVWSGKSERFTLHWKRYRFMREIRKAMPELELFGRDIRPMDDKAEALDKYKYHIAIENHISLHHWTEKLADCFLGFTLPFYYGCPNITDYFPEKSFIPIDIENFHQTVKKISQAIKNDEYEKRLSYLIEARRLVLEEYNLFAVVSREIEKRHASGLTVSGTQILMSRYALRREKPLIIFRQGLEKARNRLFHTIKSHRW